MKEVKYTILYCVFVRTFVIPFYYSYGTVINNQQFRFQLFDKLRFRFHKVKSYGSYGSGSGSGSTTLQTSE